MMLGLNMTQSCLELMPRVKKVVELFVCGRCDYKWLPRGANPPKACPKCHSPYWDSPRKNKPRGDKK